MHLISFLFSFFPRSVLMAPLSGPKLVVFHPEKLLRKKRRRIGGKFMRLRMERNFGLRWSLGMGRGGTILYYRY